MCCNMSAKRIIPFAITFAIGLLIVSGFSNLFGKSEVSYGAYKSVEKISHSDKTKCNFGSDMFDGEEEFDEIFLTAPPQPPMPPAPPVAPAPPRAVEK